MAKTQLCRLPDPTHKIPVIQVTTKAEKEGDPDKVIEVLLPSLFKLSKQGIQKSAFKVGKQVDINGIKGIFVKFMSEDCKYLNRDGGVCSLPDPTKCPGCTVVEGYKDIKEIRELGKIKVDLVQEEKINKYLKSIQETAIDLDRIKEIVRVTKVLLNRYAPYNTLTMTEIRAAYPKDTAEGRIEINDITSEVYLLNINEETGEIHRDKFIGVLRANSENLTELRRDLMSFSGLLPGIGESVASLGLLKDQAETTYKQVKGESWVQAEDFIAQGVLPYRATDETIHSLFRASEAYPRVKDLQITTLSKFYDVRNLQESVQNMIMTLKRMISSLELELSRGVSFDD